jgi:hypothetical protein
VELVGSARWQGTLNFVFAAQQQRPLLLPRTVVLRRRLSWVFGIAFGGTQIQQVARCRKITEWIEIRFCACQSSAVLCDSSFTAVAARATYLFASRPAGLQICFSWTLVVYETNIFVLADFFFQRRNCRGFQPVPHHDDDDDDDDERRMSAKQKIEIVIQNALQG